MKKAVFTKEMAKPDEHREFRAHGYLDVFSFDDGTSIGRGVFEPGWSWEADVKPIAGTDTCEADHTGYCLKGSMLVRMDGGEEFTVKAGDAYRIPSGHVASVQGTETCELFDVTGYGEYALKSEAKKKAA